MVSAEERERTIAKVTGLGIATNLVLAFSKLIVGALSHSIAITNDAINNATDTLSSVVTLAGYRASRMRPNKKHPLGYGRLEYMSALVVDLIIIVAAFQCLSSSIGRIRNPKVIAYNTYMCIILTFAIAGKVALSVIDSKSGERIDSEALKASGKDAFSDVLTSSLTLISLIFSPLTNFPIDGICGIIVSAFIFYSGVSSLFETSSALIGSPPDKETVSKLRVIISNHPPLKGGYDILLHNYGPERRVCTCNVEVPANVDAETVFDAMTDAQREILEKLGIFVTFGMYAVNDYIPKVYELKQEALDVAKNASAAVISIHAFHVHFDRRLMHFDLVVDFSASGSQRLKNEITKALEAHFPGYGFEFTVEPEYAE